MANEPIGKKAESSKEVAYRAAVLTCVLAGKLLIAHDLEAVIAAIERAEATGPMLDPTLWIKQSKAMAEDKDIIKAALPLWRLARKVLNSPEAQVALALIKEKTDERE